MATDPIAGAVRKNRAIGVQRGFALALLIVVARFVPGPQQRLFSLIEHFSYDLYFDHRLARDISRFIIVGIDEDSLKPEHLGRFPWSRSVYVKLLAQLREAKVVGIDLLFSEPSPDDAALAQALRQHGRVVLAAHQRQVPRGSELPRTWMGYGPVAAAGLPRLAGEGRLVDEFVPPVPLLARAAAGIGYVDIVPDSDGIYRRAMPLQVDAGGEVMPHFSLEIARLAVGFDPAQVAYGAAHGDMLIQNRVIPLHRGNMLINYAGPDGTVTHLSAWKVAAGQYAPDSFRDRIVIIAPTAAGLYDVRPAPFTRDNHIFYGGETNANIARTLISGDTLRDNGDLLLWGVYALILGFLVTWAIWHTSEKGAALSGLLMVVVLAAPIFFVAAALLHQIVPYGAILLGAAVPMALSLYERLGVEKRQVTKQFETYVSPDVLRELGENPDLVRQGQRRHVTLLFSDVRGSTTIAEKMDPDQWIAQLNEYLSEMSEAIFVYDGYLDKFMGDGIMAIWNAFGNQPDHAELATKAAAQMLERLRTLNEEWAGREDRVPLQIGIGLHTGEAIIGNVGSYRRAQYTAIGDAVNVASRVEALTKEFKAPLIISDTTGALLAGKLKLVELGEAELKGRAQPLRVHKPEGFAGDVMGQIKQIEK